MVVRIITFVTLVFLPATFVSTLFSTDIIKYQLEDHPDGKYSQAAMNRWLQVTIPLTFMTLLAAWCGKQWASRASADIWVRDDGSDTEKTDFVKRLWPRWSRMNGSMVSLPKAQGKGAAGPFP